MNKIRPVLIVAALALLIVGMNTALSAGMRSRPTSADQSDKYDGDCTGFETAGRCADKCLADTDCNKPELIHQQFEHQTMLPLAVEVNPNTCGGK